MLVLRSGLLDDDGDEMPGRTEDAAGVPVLPPDVPVPRARRRPALQRVQGLPVRSPVHGCRSERYSNTTPSVYAVDCLRAARYQLPRIDCLICLLSLPNRK